MQYITPIAHLLTMSRNSRAGALCQHPSVEKTVATNFNASNSQGALAPTSQSQTVPGKKAIKSALARQARPGESGKVPKKSSENQDGHPKKHETFKERQRQMASAQQLTGPMHAQGKTTNAKSNGKLPSQHPKSPYATNAASLLRANKSREPCLAA